MKVHLNQIPEEGLHLEGEDSSEILDLREPGVRPVSAIRYGLEVGVSEGGLFATGLLEVELECECVACLDQFLYPLSVPDFACQIELTGAELVDLTEPVREDILLALPPHPHCDWNGEKVCQGALRHAAATADPITETDATENTRRVWGALDQLKINKTN